MSVNGTAKDAQPGHVYLCGAGPGDPDLLTRRAAHLLATAEVVLPDDLVAAEILALANPAAVLIPVGKRCGQPRITQAGIHALMIEHARAGRSVLRLKSGDPLIFGRIAEEIDALEAASIPFEVVPGITAALAVAASLRTPLTDRSASSRLLFATAHHRAALAGELGVAAKGALRAQLPSFDPEATLALYMPGRDFIRLAADLQAAGCADATPVVAVSHAGTPRQQVVRTTVGKLAAVTPGEAPLILLVGRAIRQEKS